jgi:hypothetical protein
MHDFNLHRHINYALYKAWHERVMNCHNHVETRTNVRRSLGWLGRRITCLGRYMAKWGEELSRTSHSSHNELA